MTWPDKETLMISLHGDARLFIRTYLGCCLSFFKNGILAFSNVTIRPGNSQFVLVLPALSDMSLFRHLLPIHARSEDNSPPASMFIDCLE